MRVALVVSVLISTTFAAYPPSRRIPRGTRECVEFSPDDVKVVKFALQNFQDNTPSASTSSSSQHSSSSTHFPGDSQATEAETGRFAESHNPEASSNDDSSPYEVRGIIGNQTPHPMGSRWSVSTTSTEPPVDDDRDAGATPYDPRADMSGRLASGTASGDSEGGETPEMSHTTILSAPRFEDGLHSTNESPRHSANSQERTSRDHDGEDPPIGSYR